MTILTYAIYIPYYRMSSDEINSLSSRGKRRRRRQRFPSSSSQSEGEVELRRSQRPIKVPYRLPSPSASEVSNHSNNLYSSLSKDDLVKILSNLHSNPRNSIPNQQHNVIPEFDPNNKTQTVERWLNKVNECAGIYNWNETQIIHFSLQKLTGLAKKWYESLATLTYSWDQWQAKLIRAFPSQENYGNILEEMLSKKCRTGDNIKEYFYEKIALLSRCEIGGRKAVDCVLHGILDISIRNGAQALKCEEPEDLLSYLVSQKSRELNQGNQFRKRDNRGVAASNFYNKTDTYSSKVNSDNFTCYNCLEKGHTFHKCPKPLIKCVKCGRVGHNDNNCVKKALFGHIKSNQTTERQTLKINTRVSTISNNNAKVVENDNNKYHKNVVLNDVTMKAFIDFGSDCSLIKLSCANDLKLKEDYSKLPIIRGFGNSSIKPLFSILVNIKVDEVESEIVIYAVSDEYLHVPVLVGQNFTELPFITVLKNKENLFFYCSPIELQKDDDYILSLFVCNDVLLEQGGLVEVYTKQSYSGDIYLDGDTRLSPKQEYRLHRGCYKMHDNKCFLVVTTLTNTPVSIKKDSLLARALVIKEYQVMNVSKEVKPTLPLERSEVKVGTNLDSKEFEMLYDLLQKYRSCFANGLQELGCAKNVEMKIELADTKPVIYRPYRMSFSERQKVREIVDELLDNDIVQESESNYASPILLVRKKTGEQRLCVDFRALNAKSVKDKYPLPLIEDQISNLSGNKFFITLDLASGYYQIPMAAESRHLTAFVTPDGHYEFKRMPFGLANAPAVFQKMMNKLLGSRRFTSALAYMDDLLIPSITIEEGFKRLEDVLQLLQDSGLTLKLAKCRFFDTQLEYLGYEISAAGIKPGERKILAVKEFPVPRNIHEVRQFLGLASYFRKFVKGFGEIARPLTSLLKKQNLWKWTDTENQAFTNLKARLVERPVLALYDPKLDTELHTDASALGIGGILLQWQSNPRELKPVAYFSRQTTAEERYFHSYELETLAVVCSLKKFRVYLLGLKFTVMTDCNALRTTLTKRDLIPRIARWWLQISEFQFNIEYRAGCRMSHVDALSRNPVVQDRSNAEIDGNPVVLHITTNNWLLTLQLADPELSRIAKILKPDLDEEILEVKKNYTLKNNVLYRKVGDQLKLVVPRNARWQVCKMNHDDIGHFGQAKTTERIQSQYWFPKLRRYVKKYVSACVNCAFNKDNAVKSKSGVLYPIQKVNIPFHTIHIDHLGPFVRSKNGNSYILTVVDGFTKYLFAKPTKDTKTKNVIKILSGIFHDFGTPTRIISDRGSCFTSTQFKDFCIQHGIKHILNAVACPRANGQAERFNQTILNALAAQNYGNDERIWDLQLGKIQWGINNTINTTTKASPSMLLFGTTLNSASENKLGKALDQDKGNDSSNNESSTFVQENSRGDRDSSLGDREISSSNCNNGVPEDTFINVTNPLGLGKESSSLDDSDNISLNRVLTREKASENIRLNQEKQKKIYDTNRLPARVYEIGDLVKVVKTNFYNDGKSKKLLPKFVGPYKVTKCLGNDRYEISSVPGFNTKRMYNTVVAADHMRPWIHIHALAVENESVSDSESDNESE